MFFGDVGAASPDVPRVGLPCAARRYSTLCTSAAICALFLTPSRRQELVRCVRTVAGDSSSSRAISLCVRPCAVCTTISRPVAGAHHRVAVGEGMPRTPERRVEQQVLPDRLEQPVRRLLGRLAPRGAVQFERQIAETREVGHAERDRVFEVTRRPLTGGLMAQSLPVRVARPCRPSGSDADQRQDCVDRAARRSGWAFGASEDRVLPSRQGSRSP